ncbi:MAG: hypothetical protein R3F61_00775 [Myxococcota bacterium]
MPVVFATPFLLFALFVAGLGVLGFLFVNHVRFNWWCRAHGLPGISLREAFWAHLAEYAAVARIGWWAFRAPLANPGRSPDGRAVLFVHGYTQNSTNFWRLRQVFADLGRPTRAVFLGVAWPWRRISHYGAALVRALERAGTDSVDVVAHSMGGLVLREVLRSRPDLAPRIHSVVTLGTPHHGTAAARWFRWMHPTHELSYRSEWIEALPSLAALLPGVPVTTVGGTADMIVYPVESTTQPGARHVRLFGVGHAGLLVHPDAIQAVLEGTGALTAL